LVTITPFIDEGLGSSSNLVELADGRALVVDPTTQPGSRRSGAAPAIFLGGPHDWSRATGGRHESAK
jgi:hypothetical protein